MVSLLLRAKLKAFLIHLALSAAVATAVAAFVLHFWFPYGTLRLLGGFELLMLVIVCDVVLGPLLSFVVFNPAKPVREKVLDFSVIALVQLAGLTYGIHATAQNRLAFAAFVVDRYELVSAGELDAQARMKAPEPRWREPSYLGHHVVSAEPPRPDSPEYFDFVLKGLEGSDVQYAPERYRPLASALPAMARHIRALDELPQDKREIVESALGSDARARGELGWLLVSFQKKFWTMVVEKKTGEPIQAVDVDPPMPPS